MTLTIAELTSRHRALGRVDWIGVRPARLHDMVAVPAASLGLTGLDGDHARPGKRALTLIQAEHLPVVAALAGLTEVRAATLRRNLVVSGINLSALRNRRLRIGTAEVHIGVPCAPCSRMERALGFGGYNALRGHGGWCAEVLVAGDVALGDAVELLVG